MTTKKTVKKNKSKRMTTKLKNNIKKSIANHHRKMRKEARKMKAMGIFRGPKKEKTMHVPNLYPFKKRMIEAIENKKQTDQRKQLLEKMALKTKAKSNLSVVKEDPQVRENRYIKENEMRQEKKQRSKKQYMKEFREVINESDIILEILDARDPMGCRCREMEAEIMGLDSGRKKLILVLNKIDLVPMPVVMAWKKQLEREFACVLFKAGTQRQSDRLGTNKLFSNSIVKNPELASKIIDTQKAVGTDKLMQLIKNYSKNEGIKTSVTVGVIGFPNVGKSSLINSMKKQRAVETSGNAGHTKNLQVVEIDSKVKIIDSPGVILSNEDEVTLVLRNQVNASEVKDPVKPIEEILRRINKEKVLMLYRIAEFKNPTHFLLNVCESRGKFKKGGVPDIEATARLVIEDWNNGNMDHYLPPPGFDPTVMIDYEEGMGEEVNAMDDFVPKTTKSGFNVTDKDIAEEIQEGMQME